jgi:cyclin-dependent kinase regulatory subunit CKS1
MTADMEIDFTRRNKKPRPLSEHEKEKLDEFVDAIHYSARYVPDFHAIHVSEADECF